MVTDPEQKIAPGRARVCVLVPTFRRLNDLQRCVAALERQERFPDQVIIVSRQSDAVTSDWLASLETSLPLTVLQVIRPGVVEALNAGIKAVDADILAITDDDAAPRPDWLARIEAHFAQDAELGGLGGRDHIAGGPVESEKQQVGIMQWLGRPVGNHHRGTGSMRRVHFLKGVNMSFRVRAIDELRFDERLRGSGAQIHNDLAFSLAVHRSGWRVMYDPAVAVDHYPAPRFDEDQRTIKTLRTVEDRAFNETLIILEYLSPGRRLAFWVWNVLVGSRALPGLLQCLRRPPTHPTAWKRLPYVLRGRFAASKAALAPPPSGASFATLKRLFRPLRPIGGPIVGLTAPALRTFVRHMPEGRPKRALWRYAGALLSRGTWAFTAPTLYGFKIEGNTLDFVQRYLYYFGIWEPNLTNFILDRLRPGDTFVDVGANVGYYSLLASQAVGPGGQVVGIEASPRIYKLFQRNLALNNVRNVRTVNMAASDREGTLTLYFGPAGNSGKTSVLPQEKQLREAEVPARRLADILSEEEIVRARLFKVDVEGAEWWVVQGFADALERTAANAEFIIEISPERLAQMGRTPEDIIDLFSRAGFNAYTLDNDYRSQAYFPPYHYQRPIRHAGKFEKDIDVVFSRVDAATL